MNFTHPHFFIFLPIFLLGFLIFRGQLRLIWLLGSSYYFYGYFSWAYAILLLISTVVDFYLAKLMERYEPENRKPFVLMSIVFNLGLLFSFKYVAFCWNTLVLPSCDLFGLNLNSMESSLPPVGISFFTFQTMSYAIDVYRGNLAPAKSFLNFAVYVSMFPQLVAGPIVRAKDLLPQIQEMTGIKWDQLREGGQLFLRGFIKKACIADSLALMIVDPGFTNSESYSAEWKILIMMAYSFQIYFDFSGYSDMAIGMGKIMGFEFPKNFNHPYRSASFSEFWTRWHISLSSWLKDYLYIPLGGNRCSVWRQSFNLAITMLLGGLWHGASLMFVFWGALHGLMLILQRFVIKVPGVDSIPHVVKVAFVFGITTLIWVPFRSSDMTTVVSLWSSLFEFSVLSLIETCLNLKWDLKILLTVCIASHFLMAIFPKNVKLNWVPLPLKVVMWSSFLFWMLHFYPQQTEIQPFIYFQF